MMESGKIFSSLIFWTHGVVNEFYGATDISFQMRGPIFPSSAVSKNQVVTHMSLDVNKHATCDFKISFPVTVSLL